MPFTSGPSAAAVADTGPTVLPARTDPPTTRSSGYPAAPEVVLAVQVSDAEGAPSAGRRATVWATRSDENVLRDQLRTTVAPAPDRTRREPVAPTQPLLVTPPSTAWLCCSNVRPPGALIVRSACRWAI